MPKVVITHAVVDVERWLTGKAERAAVFSSFATQVTDHVAMDGSNNVAITADVHDLAGAQAMMAFAVAGGRGRGGEARRHPADHCLHREVAGPQIHRRPDPGGSPPPPGPPGYH